MRLFLAAELDPAARDRLDAMLARLRRSLGDTASALRWTPSANAHLTLHFLGEVDDAGAERLRAELGTSLPQPCFEACARSLRVFPPAGPPRVVWMGVSAGAHLLDGVHGELALRLRRAGCAAEDRAFAPHLTLARVRDRDRSGPGVRALRAQLAACAVDPIAWCVDHVTLFQSDLSGGAPRYASIATIPLS